MREKILEKACSGMFYDELNKIGYKNQIINGLILNNQKGKIYGPVRTLKIEKTSSENANAEAGLEFLGSLNPKEILCVQGSDEFAYFGELMTRLAVRQDLGGILIGGLTRDSHFTQTTKDITIFSQGYSPIDIKEKGLIKEFDSEVVIKNVKITQGDWIFGDSDGIAIIPQGVKILIETAVIDAIKRENDIIIDINNGLSIEKLLEKYKGF